MTNKPMRREWVNVPSSDVMEGVAGCWLCIGLVAWLITAAATEPHGPGFSNLAATIVFCFWLGPFAIIVLIGLLAGIGALLMSVWNRRKGLGPTLSAIASAPRKMWAARPHRVWVED